MSPRVIEPVPGPSSNTCPCGSIAFAINLAKAEELGAMAPMVRGSAMRRLSQEIMRGSIAESALDGKP